MDKTSENSTCRPPPRRRDLIPLSELACSLAQSFSSAPNKHRRLPATRLVPHREQGPRKGQAASGAAAAPRGQEGRPTHPLPMRIIKT